MTQQRSKRRNLAGTARCLDCRAVAQYASDGTLVIRHAHDCPNAAAALSGLSLQEEQE